VLEGLAMIGAAALALGLARWRRGLGPGLGLGLGVALGLTLILGLVWPSPRQVPERLPWLALAVALVPALAGRARLWAAAALALAAGWWMSGAPLHGPDLIRAAPRLAMIAALTLLLALGRPGLAGWRGIAAPLLMAGALSLAGAPGPLSLVALILAAAAGGTALAAQSGGAARAATAGSAARAATVDPGPLGLAALLAALAASPWLMRGSPVDAAPASLALLIAFWPRRGRAA
jgi:hypothetical protein